MSEQYFTFGSYTWDVACALEQGGEVQEVPLPVGLLGLVRIDEKYAADHPYPDEPILVAPIPDEEGWFGMPIDGWHRIFHWKEKGAETIKAVFLDPDNAYECLIRGQDAYRKMAKKAEPGRRFRKRRRRRSKKAP